MLDLINPLLAATGPALWVILSVVVTVMSFVGVTLFVALFSRDKARADRAHRILRELLAVLARGRR